MYQKILVPIDGSQTSMRGLAEAIKLAKNQHAQIRLLHIVNELIIDYGSGGGVYAGDMLDAIREGGKKVVLAAEALVRQSGLEPESVLLESLGGAAADLIVEHAKQWRADLIVMGTHGRRGLRRLALGSDAENVVRETPVPILLIHASAKDVTAAAKVKDSADAPKQTSFA